jgi:hypothetical protein
MPSTAISEVSPSNRKGLFNPSITKAAPLLDSFAFTYQLDPDSTARKDISDWLRTKPPSGDTLKGEAMHDRGSYRLGRVFRTAAKGSTVVIQGNPYQENYSFLRIEFNTGNFAAWECFINEIKPMLQMMLHGCLDEFLSPECLKITDITFTQDVLGLYPHQFTIIGKSEAIKQYTIYTNGKETKSVYVGSDKSVNQILVYDKKAQIAEKKGKIIPQTTRFEHAYKPEGGASFQELYTVTPFHNIAVSHYPQADQLPPGMDAGDFACILDAVQLHGLPKVLGRYQSKARRTQIKKLLTSQPPEWWNPQPGDFHQCLDDLGNVLFHA